jgi:hypothetical protein
VKNRGRNCKSFVFLGMYKIQACYIFIYIDGASKRRSANGVESFGRNRNILISKLSEH